VAQALHLWVAQALHLWAAQALHLWETQALIEHWLYEYGTFRLHNARLR